MRMIRLALITVFVFAFSIHSRAEVEFSAYSRMISYDQLMKLKPEQREAYMEELRILLLEMEELQTRRAEIDPQLRFRQTSMLDAFREMISDSEAMGAGSGGNRNRSCLGPTFTMVRNGRSVSCRTTASLSPRERASRLRAFDAAAARARPAPRMSRAPAGSRLFSSPLGFDSIRERYPWLYGEQPNPRMSRIQDPLTAAGRNYLAATSRQSSTRRRADGEQPAPRRTAARRATARDADESPAPARSAVRSTASDTSLVPPVQVCADEAAAIPGRTGLVCSRPAINEARVDFDGKERSCIYAGFMRPYRENVARPGQCVPIHQWCIPSEENGDPESCREPMDPAHAKVPAFSCSPSEVLCNPLLFGVKKGQGEGFARFEAYCVPKAGAATRACYQKMHANIKSENSAKPHIDLMALDHTSNMNLAKSLTEAELAAAAPQLSQLKRLWDDLATGLHRMCIADSESKGDPRQVFCEECHYIRERLHEMAALVKEKGTLCEQNVKGSYVDEDAPPAPPTVTSNSTPTTQVPANEQATITPAPDAVPELTPVAPAASGASSQ